MTDDLKQRFTFRITQANKTELIVILYEMTRTYVEDAKEALAIQDVEKFRKEIKRAKRCVEELMVSLHTEYVIARHIMQLYLYMNRELAKADARCTEKPLEHVLLVIKNLHEAYLEISKQDTSEPIMSNTQSVYAGLTYGKNDLNENLMDNITNRGFLV